MSISREFLKYLLDFKNSYAWLVIFIYIWLSIILKTEPIDDLKVEDGIVLFQRFL